MNFSNSSSLDSFNFLETARKINIFTITVIIGIGLIGHMLTIVVYGQKKFRNNSINIFLLCLAINDSAYLIVHFIEDTFRNIKEIYILTDSTLIDFLQIIDHSNFTCITISYLKYILRFISAYLIVAITIQRLIIVYMPLTTKYKLKLFAWYCVTIIIICSVITNLWVLFMFQIKVELEHQICDVSEEMLRIYFQFSLVYIFLIMIVPIAIIFICNIMVILKTFKVNIFSQSNSTTTFNISSNRSRNDSKNSSEIKYFVASSILVSSRQVKSSNMLEVPRVKQVYSSVISLDSANSRRISDFSNQLKQNQKSYHNNKTTKMLVLISFSYALLCFPHLITWSMFFIELTFNKHTDPSVNTYLFAWVQLTEIFLILNYSINSFFYCLSANLFRNQLKRFFSEIFNFARIFSKTQF